MNYSVCIKVDGKWKKLGKISINKWGKPQLSFKNSPELKEHLSQVGEWLNFSLFEDKPKQEDKVTASHANPIDLEDEIPF